MEVQAVYAVNVSAAVRKGDNAPAAVVDFFGNAPECEFVDAHGDARNVALAGIDGIDGFLGEVRHFAVHAAQRERDGLGRTGDGLVRLAVNVLVGFFEELRAGERYRGA